jgi:hypothetical protein
VDVVPDAHYGAGVDLDAATGRATSSPQPTDRSGESRANQPEDGEDFEDGQATEPALVLARPPHRRA